MPCLCRIALLASCIMLLPILSMADEPIATMGNSGLSASELEEMVAERLAVQELSGSSSQSEADIRAQAILSWAGEILKQEMKERAAVEEDAVQRTLHDWRQRGMIPPFTPAMQRFNQLALDAIAVVDAGGELSREQLSTLKDAWREVGTNATHSQEAADDYWERKVALWNAGQGCVPCHPVTQEEYDALNREVVVLNLGRSRIGREAAEFYGLLESGKLLQEAADIVEENGFSIDPQEALEILLSEREAQRWQVLKLQGGLSVNDEAIANRVHRLLREREEMLSQPLASQTAALHMHLMTIDDDGQVATTGSDRQ